MRLHDVYPTSVRGRHPGAAVAAGCAVLLAGFIAVAPVGVAHGQPRLLRPEGVEVTRDVVYGTGGGRPLRLHLVRPRERSTAPLPVVVWVHGGAWRAGNKEGGLRNVARLAQRGYAGATIEYRLSGEAIFPAQIEDCKAAIRFLRAKAGEYGLDPQRIGVWGSSAGGHLVALLGTSGGVSELEGKGGHAEQSSRVQAVCDFFGPSDFLRMADSPSIMDHNSPNSPESLLIGGAIQENRDKVVRANPITYVSKDDPPFLIMHGDRDMTVPLNQSQLLHDALKKAGVEASFEVVAGAGHGFGGPQIDAKVDAFFDRHLKPPDTVDLWPGKPPGVIAATGPEADTTPPDGRQVAGKRVIRLGNVSKPTLTIHRPLKEKDTGAAVVIAPGGGYNILAWDLEGEEVAAWLNSLGVTGIVLKYRVPRPPDLPRDGKPEGPLMDAQRAISLVRSRAKEWGIDPARIGMLGFSAGGHLSAAAATNFDRRAYKTVDEVDRASCRLDFVVLVYPAYLAAAGNQELSPEIRVTRETPPTFLVHAGDDGISAENSALLYLALKRAGVPAELHVYSAGGHGFGLRSTEQPSTHWPQRCEEWLRTRGVLRRGE